MVERDGLRKGCICIEEWARRARRLDSKHMTLVEAIRASNNEVGGRLIEWSGAEYMRTQPYPGRGALLGR